MGWLRNLTNEIATDIVIAGVKVCTIDEIPATIDPRQPTLFYDFRGDNGVSIARRSFGANNVAKTDLNYSIRYTFCYKPVGGERDAELQVAMLELADLILIAFAEFDPSSTPDISVQLGTVGNIVTDLAGNQFHGCQFVLNALRFKEVP